MRTGISSLFILLSSLIIGFSFPSAKASENDDGGNTFGHSIGSTVFLLGNFVPGDPPNFFLVNYGQQLTPQDWIYAELITWTYYEPLGSYGSSDKKYPGKVRAFGGGIGYQRFHWRHLYTTIQATPFYQQFIDTNNQKIQSGYQLYLQARVGYRFIFGNDHWHIEPSLAFNYWPINTNFPASFKAVEEGKANYYLFEPGLHFGFLF